MLTENEINTLNHIRKSRKHILIPELALMYDINTDQFNLLLNDEIVISGVKGLTAEGNPKKAEVDQLALKVIEFMRSLKSHEHP